MNLQEAMEALGIETTVVRDPYPGDRETEFPGGHHYRVTFKRGEKAYIYGASNVRRIRVPFSTGSGWTREPTAVEVMRCLLSDAWSVQYPDGFEEWAADCGYDPDSRKAEAVYNATVEQTQDLSQFLEGTYDEKGGDNHADNLQSWLDDESIMDESLDIEPVSN